MISREETQRNYDRMSRWYDLFASSEKKFTEIGLRMLDARPGERILEIGFGTGHALVALAHRVGTRGLVAGVDVSAGMIEIARKRWQAEGQERCVTMLQGDALRLPFIQGSFDAVFLSFTLELFENIPSVLKECQRVMKPGGRMGVVCMVKDETLACRLYEWGHARWPSVLDCRPIQASDFVNAVGLKIKDEQTKTMWGLPIEILVAEKMVTG